MNHWLTEELTRLTCADRQRELNVDCLRMLVKTSQANWSLRTRIALKLSDWLIETGESLRKRYEKTAPVSPFITKRNFAR